MNNKKEYIKIDKVVAYPFNQNGLNGYMVEQNSMDKVFLPKSTFENLYIDINKIIENDELQSLVKLFEIDKDLIATMELVNGYKIKLDIHEFNYLNESDINLILNKLYDKLREYINFINYCSTHKLYEVR